MVRLNKVWTSFSVSLTWHLYHRHENETLFWTEMDHKVILGQWELAVSRTHKSNCCCFTNSAVSMLAYQMAPYSLYSVLLLWSVCLSVRQSVSLCILCQREPSDAWVIELHLESLCIIGSLWSGWCSTSKITLLLWNILQADEVSTSYTVTACCSKSRDCPSTESSPMFLLQTNLHEQTTTSIKEEKDGWGEGVAMNLTVSYRQLVASKILCFVLHYTYCNINTVS